MPLKTSSPVSRWARLRGPVAVIAVAGILGVAIVAPMTSPTMAEADFDAAAFQERIHQQFVPNASPEDDLVLTDFAVTELPDPEEERRKQEEAAAKAAAEAAEKAAQNVATAAPAEAPRYSGGGSPAEWMAAAGIAESDWGYVDYIATRESGWNPNATNPSSGACGVIQANPCSKVPGGGYDPVANLTWANGYAVGRYGSWAGAYAFWTSNHWW